VARNSHGQGIRGAGSGDSTRGIGQAELLRQFRIGAGRATGDFAQCFPNPLLKRRALDVQRQFQSGRWVLDQGNHPSHHALELRIAAD